MIGRHRTEFAGLPVHEFDPEATPPADPSAVAWRIAFEHDGDWDEDLPSPAFAQRFEQFLDTVDPASVTALVLGSWGYAAFNTPPYAQLCAAADRLTGLRALFLGDMMSEECEISWIRQEDVAPVLEAYPALEVLRVRGSEPHKAPVRLRPVRHGLLRELAFESGGLSAELVRAVGECDLPALTHLELWLGTDNYGGNATVEDLAPILAGTRLPALTYLGLRDAEIADQVAAALAGAPVVARLHTLDLSLGMFGDRGAAALLAGQPLTHLRRLDLNHHFVTDDLAARLVAELPGVDVDLTEGIDADDEDEYYVAVAE
ncbi:STM4015 family protein [Micromonospora sp. NBC_01699]|uniref:STM4015 family protein n=1 Tax=Micromonospora sp. NBC_01699 TaxID=2975984 RepID=UPI002E286E62|nr:STM4015 family protein [Micromonospora sp. NBC_01699]